LTTRLPSPYSNYAYAVLTAQALRAPDAVAVTQPGRGDVTYAELDARVNQRAYALASAGVQPGARVAALLSDPMAIIELYLAQAKLGAVTAAMNPYWPDDVLAAVSETSGCRAFVYDTGAAAAVSRVRGRLPQIGNWMQIGGPADGALDLDALTANAPSDPPVLGAAAEDPLALFFTSGTTGLPKAVVHSHASATAVAQIWLDLPRSPGGAFATGPIIWGVGFAVIAGPALYGAMRLVLAPAFGPAELLQIAASQRVTHISVIPSFFAQLFSDERHRDADLSSLQVIMLGAEPLLPSLLERIRARMPQASVYSYYGATEAPYSCWALQDDRSGGLSVSGRPRTGGAVRVVDSGGARVVGEIGEIQLTGPHLMTGYDGRPEQTTAVLRDGWYVGGDLGVIDEAGVLTVLGRREDAIRKFGRWALPSEIEDAALALEEIAEAGAAGVPEDGHEQQILLAVVPREGVVVDADGVRARLTTLREESRPDAVIVVSELPHANDASGGRGKLLRREIRARWGSVLAGESAGRTK
jgi:fatty-acyl-CoA synthase